MDLKELLGEDLYNQVTEKVGDDHKIAIVSNGNWIPKDKFDSKNNEVKELKKQLAERDDQLDQLKTKAAGHEDLTNQINELKELNAKTTKEYQEKLEQQAFDFALERSLNKAKAKNPKAVRALLETENIKLDGDKLIGLDDQLKAIKESDPYLFEDEDNKPIKKPQFSQGSFQKISQSEADKWVEAFKND